MIKILKDKIAAGTYESSNSLYWSRYFVVPKKNGTLRLVHDLQPLSRVTITLVILEFLQLWMRLWKKLVEDKSIQFSMHWWDMAINSLMKR